MCGACLSNRTANRSGSCQELSMTAASVSAANPRPRLTRDLDSCPCLSALLRTLSVIRSRCPTGSRPPLRTAPPAAGPSLQDRRPVAGPGIHAQVEAASTASLIFSGLFPSTLRLRLRLGYGQQVRQRGTDPARDDRQAAPAVLRSRPRHGAMRTGDGDGYDHVTTMLARTMLSRSMLLRTNAVEDNGGG